VGSAVNASHAPHPGTVTENDGVSFDEGLAGRIRDLVQAEKGLTEKKMFGGLAFLIGGNMAISASGQGGLLVRSIRAKPLNWPAGRMRRSP
jgi:hypothetical protein